MLVPARFTGSRVTRNPSANSKAKQETVNYGITKSNENYNQDQKRIEETEVAASTKSCLSNLFDGAISQAGPGWRLRILTVIFRSTQCDLLLEGVDANDFGDIF